MGDGMIKVHALILVRGKIKPVYCKTDNWDDAKYIIEQFDSCGLWEPC